MWLNVQIRRLSCYVHASVSALLIHTWKYCQSVEHRTSRVVCVQCGECIAHKDIHGCILFCRASCKNIYVHVSVVNPVTC